MNWEIKIISKTLMTKISHISWGGYNKGGVTTKAFTVCIMNIVKLNENSIFDWFQISLLKIQDKEKSWLETNI